MTTMASRLKPLLPLLVVFGVVNMMLTDRFHQRILTLTLLWAVAAIAWNLTAKAGQISLGHSAFTGIGAYTFALLLIHWDVSPWLGMIAGMAVAAVAAVLIGLPSFKLEGFYFTLATIAYPLILLLLVIYFGQAELSIPLQLDRPWFAMQFRDQRMYVWIAMGLLAATMVLQAWIDGSRFGYYLRAIRDNEILAEAVGIRTVRWKLAAFAISAAMTAAMAVVWVNSILFVVTAEQVFGLVVVIEMLSLVFVGGIATLWGPVVGAVTLIPLALLLQDVVGDRFPGTEALMYGLALVIVAILVPDGLVSRFRRWRQGRRSTPQLLDVTPEQTGKADKDVAPEPVAVGATPMPDKLSVDGRPAIIETDSISKSFGGLRALSEVSLTIPQGVMVGIIGPNGAGKTTLFNVLTGFLKPDEGTVRFEGSDITAATPPDRYAAGISRTFQVPQGFHRMTPRENVLVAAFGAGAGQDRVDTVLERVGLDGTADTDMSSLSTLDVKKLEIARAVVSKPKLLLVDEPLAGLNREERDGLMSLLRSMGFEDDMTIVVIEHSVRSLIKFVDHLVALDGGRLLTEGSPDTVVADGRVIESYLGRRWNTGVDDQGSKSLV